MDCLVRVEDGADIGRILWIIWEADIDEGMELLEE